MAMSRGYIALSFIILLANILGTFVRCDGHSNMSTITKLERSDIVQVLSDLIWNFTYVMDLQLDSELFNSTTSAFESALSLATYEESLPILSELFHLALLGAYKVQCHTIKDKLSKSGVMAVQGSQIYSIAPWSTQLLQYLLKYMEPSVSSTASCSALELAIKLQNLEAAKMIVERGGKFCESFGPPKCNNALHFAVINNNQRDLEYIINSIKVEYLRSHTLNTEMNLSLFQSLLLDTLAFDSTFFYSPLQISNLHCVVGLSCVTYSYLTSYLLPHHQKLSLPPKVLQTQTCSADDVDIDDRKSYYVNTKQTSGWKSYNGFKVGKDNPCDLPRLNVRDSDFFQQFERLFVDLGVPVIIEGMTEDWQLQQSWKRHHLLERWSQIDILVGPIPYGEVFGEKFGYATIGEFVAYMDGYTLSPWSSTNHSTFQAPLYVFDSEVLQENFLDQYNITGLLVPSLRSAVQHHQFILGPAGSGAPFHFHCHAFNALIFGRKKWFIQPPVNKIYSKQHPLLWYKTQYTQLLHKPIECVQHAAEVIYVPSSWSHATINLDECIGLAIELDTGNC